MSFFARLPLYRIRLIVFAVIACRMAPPAALAETPTSGDEIRAERLRQMKERAEAIVIEHNQQLIGLQSDPLLRFDGPTANCLDATIWAAESTGRPPCLVVVERYPDFWSHELVSLTSEPLMAKLAATGRHWSPRPTGFQMTLLPDTPGPVGTSRGRLRQMREIARRFALETRGENEERYEPYTFFQIKDRAETE